MEAVRKIIDSDSLEGIISLPKIFKNRKVEVIVFLTDDRTGLPSLKSDEIDTMLKGSVTESLIGCIPYSGQPLGEYRSERLAKYDRAH